MKKVFLIVIISVLLGSLFFGVFQFFVKSASQKGALQVTSTPESKVYLNDVYIGKTPLCKCEASEMQKIGEYTIRLVPENKDLTQFQEKITISEGVLTVIDRKFGMDSLSEGSVISLTKLDNKRDTELLAVSVPSKSKIFLDNNLIGETPFLLKNPTESDHTLKLTKEGYKDKTIRIRTPMGYKLTVVTYLSTGSADTEPQASPSASLSPTPVASVSKVTILDTTTGFLRVRSAASLTGVEVARVLAGETPELVSEQPGWFQIKLKDDTTGWISSQYASRQ